MDYYNNVYTKAFPNGVCSIDANHNHNQYALECYDNSADEALAILSRGELREMADAIYQELGLGWLPYPENKPEHEGAYLITYFINNNPDNPVIDGDYYDETGWDKNDGFVIAFMKWPAPYQPA